MSAASGTVPGVGGGSNRQWRLHKIRLQAVSLWLRAQVLLKRNLGLNPGSVTY